MLNKLTGVSDESGRVDPLAPTVEVEPPPNVAFGAPQKEHSTLETGELLRMQLRGESVALSAFSFLTGKVLPDELSDDIQFLEKSDADITLPQFTKLHSGLTDLVSLALPGAISHFYHHAARTKFQN